MQYRYFQLVQQRARVLIPEIGEGVNVHMDLCIYTAFLSSCHDDDDDDDDDDDVNHVYYHDHHDHHHARMP